MATGAPTPSLIVQDALRAQDERARMFERLRTLLAERWQIPLAMVAAAVGATSLMLLMPGKPDTDFGALMADVRLLRHAGDHKAAANAVANLLAADPDLPKPKQAVLQNELAELVYEAERDRPIHEPANVARLIASQEAAWRLGQPRTAVSGLRVALAHQWLGQDEAALRGLRAALDQDLPVDERRRARKAAIQLLEQNPDARLERRHLLDQLLADDSLSLAYLWWGLQHAVQDALDQNDALRARQLLTERGQRLTSSDLKGYLDYLWALVMVHEGRAAEAEPVVRWIHDWLGDDGRDTAELDRYGDLPSLNRWLMGQIHLAEDRPQEALAAFEDALRWEPEPRLHVAASVGRGMSLAALRRHEAALAAFAQSLEAAGQDPQHHRRALHAFRAALRRLYERQREWRDYDHALRYLALAAELTPTDQPQELLEVQERLGLAYREAAEYVTEPEVAREYWARAGEGLERAADLVQYDEPKLATLLWSAADAYDRAGRIASLRRVLDRFVAGRVEDPRMPRAMLQLGQACDALGDLEGALGWYDRLMTDYPALQEALQAQVLRAGVLVAVGAEHYPEAEATLVRLMESDQVAPEAPTFRDAHLGLCELLYHQGRYGEAISRLEDFLNLYPQDPERVRSRFMLADAYRRSANALRREPPAGTSAKAAEVEARERLRTAADLFDALLREADNAEVKEDEALEVYTRLALFYRGDCLFDLNEPETLQAALATYRNAAARYAGRPAALTAHVQIANIHLRQGDVVEAARAIEKARWLLRSIPDEAFVRAAAGDRKDWEEYLSVVSSSSLFREVFAGPR